MAPRFRLQAEVVRCTYFCTTDGWYLHKLVDFSMVDGPDRVVATPTNQYQALAIKAEAVWGSPGNRLFGATPKRCSSQNSRLGKDLVKAADKATNEHPCLLISSLFQLVLHRGHCSLKCPKVTTDLVFFLIGIEFILYR